MSELNKTAKLTQQTFYSITRPLKQIILFHTGRGNEFENKIIDEILSIRGVSCDNAEVETTYKTSKMEFINGKNFKSLTQLKC